MSVSVTWYDHSNFKVSCGDVTVFIDPFFTHNPSCPVTWNEAGKPDLVLVTHDHGDHTGDTVAICKSSGATCGCIVGTDERLIYEGADLLYHLIVLLTSKGYRIEDLARELEERHSATWKKH